MYFKNPFYLQVYTFFAPIFICCAIIDSSSTLVSDNSISYITTAGNLTQSILALSTGLQLILSYVSAIYYRRQINEKLWPQTYRLYTNLKQTVAAAAHFTTPAATYHQDDLLLKIIFKSIVIPVLHIVIESYKFQLINGRSVRHLNFVRKLFLFFPSWIVCVIPNVFAASMAATTYGFRQLNDAVANVMSQSCQMHETKRFWRMNRFCLLSDRLDVIAVLHFELCSFTKTINRLFSLIVFFWFYNRIAFILAQTFYGYLIASAYVGGRNYLDLSTVDDHHYPLLQLLIVLCGHVELILMIVDLYLMINVCCEMEMAVEYFFFTYI